jgi:hypothetical protein
MGEAKWRLVCLPSDARGPVGGLEVDARPGRPGKTPGFLLRGALTRTTLSLRKFYRDFY